ncbi:hypothetical protein VTO42DRAFT_38 [Malbranchea cinnamomea]
MVTTRHHPEEFPPPPSSKYERSSAESLDVTQQWAHRVPNFLLAWLSLSVPIVLWDAGYCLLRPHSMPGGKWHTPWIPYALYGAIDYIYGWPAYHAKNGFTSAQAALNVVESGVYIIYLISVWRHGYSTVGGRARKAERTRKDLRWFFIGNKKVPGREGAVALLVVFSGCVVTFSKTLLYWLCEVYAGFDNIGHNDLYTLIFLWIVPNGLWLVFPAIASYLLGKEIVQGLQLSPGGSSTKREKDS